MWGGTKILRVMARFLKNREKATGQVPGELVFIGRKRLEKSVIKVVDYTPDEVTEKEVGTLQECLPFLEKNSVTWITVMGLHNVELMKEVSVMFNIPSLLMEDILSTDQVPGYEVHENFDAFLLKSMEYSQEEDRIYADQIAILLGDQFVLTLQERENKQFDYVRHRINNSKGRIRKRSADYLAYALLDTLADHYIMMVEATGRRIEAMEEALFNGSKKDLSRQIYHHKTEMRYLRQSVRPVKELVNQLLKAEEKRFQPETEVFLEDLKDLVNQAVEAIELYNSMLSDQLNIYNTNVNNRMNQVMKTLTIFASIFIPLTFIAGVYGMNFEHIPELAWQYSYPVFWSVSLAVGITLLLFFKRKGWL